MDDNERARVIRLRRLVFALAGSFIFLLTVGTSLIFAGYPGLGITLVAVSPFALVAVVILLIQA
jgi:hypothetical protein